MNIVIVNGTALNDNGIDAPALFGTAQTDIMNANWSAGDDVTHTSAPTRSSALDTLRRFPTP